VTQFPEMVLEEFDFCLQGLEAALLEFLDFISDAFEKAVL